MDCFEKIVGLSKAECDCFKDLVDAKYKDSTSGLYVDELEETSFILKALTSLGGSCRTLNNYFNIALSNAVSSFKEKLFMEIGSRYTVKQNPFNGLVGQLQFSQAVNTTSTLIGSAYEMMPLRGGVMKIDKLWVCINQSATVNINIYKAYIENGIYNIQELITTIAVNAVANTATKKDLTTALELPLADDTGQVIQYLFIMDRSSGFLPMDNKASCGCNKQFSVEKWLTQYGIEGDLVDSLPSYRRKSGKTANINGIVINAEIKCGDVSFVCENYNSNPYLKVAIEYAIYYQAASNLLDKILRADEFNKYTMTKREQMTTDVAILHNMFKSRISWIAENMDMRLNNCFVCNTLNETSTPYKSGIRF
jgi:hypothetical protein